MDFEEFKKKFEVFTKIDTPEKLAICERQYQQEILRIEDQNYFEPVVSVEPKESDFLNNYEKNLRLILGIDTIKDNEIAFFIRPSFQAESLLIIKQTNNEISLIFKVAVGSYWTKYYENNSVTDHKTTTVECELDNGIGKKLLHLLNHTFINARPPKVGLFVLDGTRYILLRSINNKIEEVTKHSPDQTSRSGKTIEVLFALIEYVKAPDQILLKKIDKEISDLLE